MPDLTPIRIRGKRTAKKDEKWDGRKRRRLPTVGSAPSTDSDFASSKTALLVRAAAQRSQRRVDLSLSKLEQLPTEVLQDIFEHSVNLSLPLASPQLASQLANGHLHMQITSIVLQPVLGLDTAVNVSKAELAEAVRLMNSKFFTWAFFSQWLGQELGRSPLSDEWRAEQEDTSSKDIQQRNKWIWQKLGPSPALVPPRKLLRAPFTAEKVLFLNLIAETCKRSSEYMDDVYDEMVQEGLQQVVEEGASDALDAFWSLGAHPDTELLRKAVIDVGCEKNMVQKLVAEGTHSFRSGAIDFLDPVLWAWADKAKAHDHEKGSWCIDLLRNAARHARQENAVDFK